MARGHGCIDQNRNERWVPAGFVIDRRVWGPELTLTPSLLGMSSNVNGSELCLIGAPEEWADDGQGGRMMSA